MVLTQFSLLTLLNWPPTVIHNNSPMKCWLLLHPQEETHHTWRHGNYKLSACEYYLLRDFKCVKTVFSLPFGAYSLDHKQSEWPTTLSLSLRREAPEWLGICGKGKVRDVTFSCNWQSTILQLLTDQQETTEVNCVKSDCCWDPPSSTCNSFLRKRVHVISSG